MAELTDAEVFGAAPVELNDNEVFGQGEASRQQASRPPVEDTPASVAQRLGIPGAERLQASGAEGMSQAALETSARELERPLLTLPASVKQGLGTGALAALSPLTLLLSLGTKSGEQVAKGMGEALGSLVESATSPVGALTLAAAVARPHEIVPLLMAGGAKQGSDELAEGMATGDLSKIAQGATTLTAASAPLALSALRGMKTSVDRGSTIEIAKLDPAGPVYFHGTTGDLAGSPSLAKAGLTSGIRNEPVFWLSAKSEGAQGFAKMAVMDRGGQPKVHKFSMAAKNPLTVKVSVHDIIGDFQKIKSDAITKATKDGNDAVIFKGPSTLADEIAVLDPAILTSVKAAVQFSKGRLLPELQDHATAKAVFSKPFGAGNLPVLGRIIDPHARTLSNLDEALAAYHAERHGVGPAAAANAGLQLKARGIDEAFPVNPKSGELVTVQPTRPGQSLYPSDVMEALQKDPDSYVLSEPQRAAFSELERWRKEANELEQTYGIEPGSLLEQGDSAYFPRIVIERPPEDVASSAGGGRVGGKQFFQKQRMFESEAEGVQRGYRYEPSLVSRATTRTERLYKAIADKRLADDKTLGARTRQQVESELREAYSEELGAGTMTEAKLQQIVSSVEHKGSVWGQPGFAGKIFDAETANVLNKAFPQADSTFRHRFTQANNTLKAMRLSADLGVTLLQGQLTMFRHPIIWSKATVNSLRALFDDGVLARYAAENTQAVSELAQLGSSVGRLQEMLAGVEKGSLLERIPVVRVPFKAAARQFETFLDVAKVELWKAWRNTTPPEQRLQVVRTLESQLAMGRMESIGVSRNRALLERTLLLAPSYYRGAINLVGAIGERGVSGKIARQALSAYTAGGLLTFYGIAQALGMDEAEIQERFNPTNSSFLMWDVEVNGRNLTVGFGGIHRSLLRLLANMTKTSIEHPENWLSLTPAKNPLVRWYRGHAASVPGITWDAITGRDFLGQESDLTTVGQSVVPLPVQPLIKSPKETQAAEMAASIVGLSAYTKD